MSQEEIMAAKIIMSNNEFDEDLGESEYEYQYQTTTTAISDVIEIKPMLPRLPIWATPPWPEWNDSAINVEAWEVNESIERFIDPTGMILPKPIKPVKWVRPEFLLEPAKLVDWGSGKIDLINANIHICEMSDEIRFMLSEISELYDHGVKNAFQVEGEGTDYVPNSDHHMASWSPWDHIYSDCKAGVKGDRPSLNQIGKYYVRLYFMGAWRRITVDDQIPLLQDDRIALPITSNNELWPLILVKALIKLASLSWDSEQGEGVDKVHRFSTTTALTGWVHEWVDVGEDPINNMKLWIELNDILPKYQGKQEEPVDSNYWTSGKTKKQRLAEQMMAQKRETERQAVEVPKDVYTNWWTLINSLAVTDPNMEYLEYSDSDDTIPTTAAEKIPKEADYYSTSVFSSGGEEEGGADEAEEATDLEEEMTENIANLQQETLVPPVESVVADDAASVYPQSKSSGKVKAGKGKGSKNKKGKNKAPPPEADSPVKKKASRSRSNQKKKLEIVESKPETPLEDEGEEEEEASPPSPVVVTVVADENKKESKKGRKNKKHAAAVSSPGDVVVEDAPNKLSFTEKRVRIRVPLMKDILEGIYKCMGTENIPLVAAWESLSGKNIPDVITVLLSLYPRVENAGTVIPSFLFHPINFVEVRDSPLIREPGRPVTPLWKTFRWKDWAMKKGLIPMETDPSNIRCIKAKTPFAIKTDWYHFQMGMTHVEALGKGEDDEEEYLVGYAPPGTPVDEVCGGGGTVGDTVNENDEQENNEGSNEGNSPPDTSTAAAEHKASRRSVAGKKSKKKRASKISVLPKKSSFGSNPEINNKNGSKERPPKSRKSKSLKKQFSKQRVRETLEEEEQELSWLLGSWEEEEDLEMFGDQQQSAPLPTPASDAGLNNEIAVPTSACGNVWFHVDNVSQYIRKLCKHYSTRTIFGACFTLRRKPDWTPVDDADSVALLISGISQEDLPTTAPEITLSQKEIINYHSVPDSFNLTIQFETAKMLSINNSHLDKSAGIDSAFYLFSDCWMVQEILVSLDILQNDSVNGYADKLDAVAWNYPEEGIPKTPINVGVILEPWDWRKDSYSTSSGQSTPLVRCVTDAHWSAHVMLRPGRNLFRVWVAENPDQGEGICNTNPYTMSPYVIKFSSKTPIHVGSRDEILKYMTNEPMLLLKQSDTLAQNFWALFLLFGKPKEVYIPNLKSLHKAYCPSYKGKEPNCFYKKLKNVHFTFENKFLALIVKLNEGRLDRMLLLAMRCLFINPTLGQDIWESSHPTTPLPTDLPVVVLDVSEVKQLATLVIQRYCRGWMVRRLFQLRTPGRSPKYNKIELQVRKMAYLLALNTDSAFTQVQQGPETGVTPIDPDPTLTTVDTADPATSPPLVPDTLLVERETSTKSTKPSKSKASKKKKIKSSEQKIKSLEPKSNSLLDSNQNIRPSESMVQFAVDEEENEDETTGGEGTGGGLNFVSDSETPTLTNAQPPTLVPNPPKWAVNLLKDLLKEHPLLYALHPHAYSMPNHIKIRDTEGYVSSQAINCAPFYRRVICVVGEGNWSTCMIQLQITPPTKAVMRVIDNDTQTCLEGTLNSENFFVGKLQFNQLGYTILCYRLGERTKKSKVVVVENENPFCHQWKLRMVTPTIQDLAYRDEIHEHHYHAHHHHHHHHQELFQFVPEESTAEDSNTQPPAFTVENDINNNVLDPSKLEQQNEDEEEEEEGNEEEEEEDEENNQSVEPIQQLVEALVGVEGNYKPKKKSKEV